MSENINENMTEKEAKKAEELKKKVREGKVSGAIE